MGIEDRRRHQHLGLAAGVAEHHALVAGALVLVACGVHPLGDVARLLVDEDLDLCGLPVNARLLVPDLADAAPRDLLEVVVGDRSRPPHLPRHHDPIGRGEGLDGDPGVRVGAEVGIDNGV